MTHPGLPNPEWRLDAGDYLRLLGELPRSDDRDRCCGSPSLIVHVVQDDTVIGRQVIGERVVLSLSEGQHHILRLGDAHRLTSLVTSVTNRQAPGEGTVFGRPPSSRLEPLEWPNCECGVVPRALQKWGRAPLVDLNCYSFAVNCTEPSKVGVAQPGRRSLGKCDQSWRSPADRLIEGAVGDGLRQVRRIEWPPPSGHHFAALLIDQNEPTDFHWLRLEPNRVWAHKWGECAPHLCDDQGELVKFDSRSRNYRSNGGISRGDFGRFTFCAMFRVPPNQIVC